MQVSPSLLMTIALLTLTGTAMADVHANPHGGVQVDVPHDWKTHVDGDVLVATDPHEEAAVIFVVSNSDDMKKVGDAVDAELGKVAKNVKWGAQHKVTMGGMSGISMDGSASIDGHAVSTGAIIVVTPKKKGVFLIGFAQKDKEAKHSDELAKIAGSLALTH